MKIRHECNPHVEMVYGVDRVTGECPLCGLSIRAKTRRDLVLAWDELIDGPSEVLPSVLDHVEIGIGGRS